MPKPDKPRRRRRPDAEGSSVPPIRAERPARPIDPGRLLLAKILATLFGTLVGLFVASGINVFFTSDFERLQKEGETRIAQAEQRLPDVQDQRNKLLREKQRIQGQFPFEELSELQRKRVAEINEELRPLDDFKSELDSTIKGATTQIEEAEGYILLLNLLSIAVVVILSMTFYLFYPALARRIDRSAETWIAIYAQAERRSQTLLIGFFGGLVIAVVILLAVFTTFNSGPFASPVFRLIFGTFFIVAMGTAGSLIAVNYFGPGPRRIDPYREYRALAKPKVLDTSVLIDGRVQEVAATGFLDGALVVVNSVLRELQNLADSSDGRKRDKGRRGLELVREMQDDPRLHVKIFDDSDLYDGARATDEQLIVVAQSMGAAVVTNDYNLNRVAAIRDVQVINLNALANAVKTRHVPGDMIEIHISDRGKQRGQGVGYLEDGTMVVVEDGEPYIRQTRTVKLTSVTQTVQGRLIFGRVDLAEEEARGGG